MLVQAGFFANVFEQILAPARRPWEQSVNRLILFEIFLVSRQPILGKLQLAFLVAICWTGVADENLRAVAPFDVNVVEMDSQTFALLDTCCEQERQEGEWTC